MNLFTTCLIACSTVLFPGPKQERVTIEELLTAAPVPEGYAVTLKELKNGDDLLGHQLLFTKEEQVSKVMATIEDRKLPDKGHKIAALKGYINGTARMFSDAGLKLVKKEIPDVEKLNVNKRTKCSLVYQTAEGGEIYVQMQIFFTDHGYSLTVIADNKDDYDALAEWASTIEPLKDATQQN
jgi:hypothetical protein